MVFLRSATSKQVWNYFPSSLLLNLHALEERTAVDVLGLFNAVPVEELPGPGAPATNSKRDSKNFHRISGHTLYSGHRAFKLPTIREYKLRVSAE
ncbi:hypothetical protein PM082_009074 [Marasmius tenuissimus]|nr:hypothetical protein PM082_009074 [Marasmius tenuissimus]